MHGKQLQALLPFPEGLDPMKRNQEVSDGGDDQVELAARIERCVEVAPEPSAGSVESIGGARGSNSRSSRVSRPSGSLPFFHLVPRWPHQPVRDGGGIPEPFEQHPQAAVRGVVFGIVRFRYHNVLI